jgi:hypothetical protein
MIEKYEINSLDPQIQGTGYMVRITDRQNIDISQPCAQTTFHDDFPDFEKLDRPHLTSPPHPHQWLTHGTK